MEGVKKTVYVVSILRGYRDIAFTFEDIQKATELFAYLSNANLPVLDEVKKGDKTASYFNGKYDVKIETEEVTLYKDQKSAKFAVSDGNDNEE